MTQQPMVWADLEQNANQLDEAIKRRDAGALFVVNHSGGADCGNERLSCVFRIMASKNDLRNGAIQNPELYREHVELERETGYTLHMSRQSLPELTGISI